MEIWPWPRLSEACGGGRPLEIQKGHLATCACSIHRSRMNLTRSWNCQRRVSMNIPRFQAFKHFSDLGMVRMSPPLFSNFYELITILISSATQFNTITFGAWPWGVSNSVDFHKAKTTSNSVGQFQATTTEGKGHPYMCHGSSRQSLARLVKLETSIRMVAWLRLN